MPRKGGFWIKKDGYIAVDTTMSPRIKNRIAKLKKELPAKNPLIPGKGSVYLRKVYIPHLRKKIQNERMYVVLARKHNKEIEAKAKVLVNQIKQGYKDRLKEFKREQSKRVTKKVREIASAKPKFPSLERYTTGNEQSKYYGPFYMIISNRFCKENNLNPKFLNMMVCVSFYRVFKSIYLKHWGLTNTNPMIDFIYKQLISKEYIQRIPDGRGLYVFTLKGLDFMKTFDEYFDKGVKTILKSLRNGATKKKPSIRYGFADFDKSDRSASIRKPGRPRQGGNTQDSVRP